MPDPNRALSEGKIAALTLLKQAFDDAEDVGKDPKQFAVSRIDLAAHGASESDVRWLLDRRYADQLEETSRRGHNERQFRVVSGLMLIDKGCFVLTYGGKTFVEANRLHGLRAVQRPAGLSALSARDRIRWDRARHELWVDGKLAKRFYHSAWAQWPVLDMFESEHWEGPVETDPRGGSPRDPRQRLRELVAELNRGLDTSLIHFRKDGESLRITFDLP